MKFSPSTGCFYPEELVYNDSPGDLIEVSQEEFSACLSRGPNDTIKVQNGKLKIIKSKITGEENAR